MQRVIPITINIKTGTTDSQIMMYRGDNVKFQFNFTDTSSVSLDTATKLRVLVKPANDLKASYVWFSGEATITAEDYSIEFTSEQTSGYAGNGFLAVLVLDANNETVCTAGIPFRVEPSGYDGIYTPSEDFRDEVYAARDAAVAAAAEATNQANLASTRATAAFDSANLASTKASQASSNAIKAEGYAIGTAGGQDVPSSSPYYENNSKYYSEQAKNSSVIAGNLTTQAAEYTSIAESQANNAKTQAELAATSAQTAQQAAAQAVEITDPEGWRTDTRAMIARLALAKSDSGILYFTGGAATATPDLASDTISVLFKTDFDFSVVQTADLHVFFPFYIGTTGKGNFFSCQYGRNNKLTVHRAVGGNAAYVGNFDRANIAPLTGNGLNALAFVFKKLADGNTQLSLYVNGVLVPNNATAAVAYPTLDSFISINKWGSTATSKGTVSYSDFRIFNFDVSAEDAPYSLADYQAGKRLPPSLTGVQLALENYTIARNTTTKLIKDTSGNGNDATVSGNVAGDMDIVIAAVVDELKTQISQNS